MVSSGRGRVPMPASSGTAATHCSGTRSRRSPQSSMSPWASSEPVPSQGGEQQRRGRRVALLILALCAAPTVAAWFAYFVWQPQSRTNYGDLIEPHPLSDPELRRLDGGAFRLSQLRGRWVLLQIDSAAC